MEAAMYERMLNKTEEPTIAEMTAYCGENGGFFTSLNEWLSQTFATEQKVVFPYGNQYGWGSPAEAKTGMQYFCRKQWVYCHGPIV